MADAAAFDRFYADTAARVVSQVYVMIGDLAEAEDAVQEAYARAWQRWARVGAYADPTGWVRTVAYRVAVSSWRRSRPRLAAHLRSADPRPAPDLKAETLALGAALRLIPVAQRRAIVLDHHGPLRQPAGSVPVQHGPVDDPEIAIRTGSHPDGSSGTRPLEPRPWSR